MNWCRTFLACIVLWGLPDCQSFAQVVIHGKVTSGNGINIQGATLMVDDSVTASVTDQDGNYEISILLASGPHRLSCSYTGYQTQVLAFTTASTGKYLLNFTLQPVFLDLGEVVVTGNAVNTTRRKLGNSITVVQADLVKYSATSHVSALLNGKVMGAVVTQNSGDPGGGFSLKLRGVGSVFGSSEPLYIVDGIAIDNSSQNLVNLNLPANTRYQTGNNRIIDINPRDIDRIEVINGAAASAIYGSRASHGVVQIFTKKGTKGKPKVTFSSSVNVNALAKKIDVNLYPYRFGIPQSPRLDQSGDNRTMILNTRPNQAALPGAGPQFANGTRLDTTRYPVTRYDYQDDIFTSSFGTDQHISLSGGGDKGNYYASGSYLSNGGIMLGTSFQKYGLTLSNSYQVNNWLEMGGGLIFANSRSEEKPNSFQQFSPIGSMNHTDNVYNIRETDSVGNLKAVEYTWVNPKTPVQNDDLTVETNRIIGNLTAKLTPWKGVVVSGTWGIDGYSQQGFTYQARIPYQNVSLGLFPDGYVSASKLNYQQQTTELTASYTNNFSDKFSSSTVAGLNGQYIRTNFQAQEGRNLLPIIQTIKAAQNFHTAPVDLRTEQTIFGYFLQQTFGYQNLAFLTLAGRFDRSSAYGKNVGNIFYPKLGISFTVSDLLCWRKGSVNHWFNTMHLRASYGQAGNLNVVGPYDRFTTTVPVTYNNGIGGFAPQNRVGNENIRPETKTEFELGADMQFLNSRLSLRATIYQQEISDLVIPYNLAPSNGYTSILSNLGTMQNKGIELLLAGSPLKKQGLTWDISFMLNINKNKVTSLYPGTSYIGFETTGQGAVVGYPVGVFYGTYYARNTDGELLLKDNKGYLLPQIERGDADKGVPIRVNGQPSGSPLNQVLGSPHPEYTATVINELQYKQFKLRLQLDRVSGAEMYNWTRIIRNNIGNGLMAEKELRGELSRGWVAAIGGTLNGIVIQEEFSENASFSRIRELSLAYTFTDRFGLKNLELILTGRNLFTFTSYDGFDPETNVAGQSIIRGSDYGSYPIPRVIQFSLIASL